LDAQNFKQQKYYQQELAKAKKLNDETPDIKDDISAQLLEL